MDKIECVYFIHAEGTDFVKVGWTSDLHKRFDQLQTACPHKLELLGIELGPRDREHIIHGRMRQYRERGEWFLLTEIVREWLADSLYCNTESLDAHQRFRLSRCGRGEDDDFEYGVWLRIVKGRTGRELVHPADRQAPDCEAA